MLNECIRRYFFLSRAPERSKEAKKYIIIITPDLRLSVVLSTCSVQISIHEVLKGLQCIVGRLLLMAETLGIWTPRRDVLFFNFNLYEEKKSYVNHDVQKSLLNDFYIDTLVKSRER